MQLIPQRLPHRTDRTDAGYTLIELLVVAVILAVIALPLGNAVIVYFRNSDATSDQLALSHDAQISAAYVARDVAAVGLRDTTATGAGGTIPFKASIQLDAAYNAGGFSCGSATTPTAKIRLLSDDWDSTTTPATLRTQIVAYYLTASGSVSSLHRLRCAGGASTDVVIAHNVDPATFTVTCASPTSCDTTAVPQTVTLAFSVTRPSAAPYPISLTGHRRQQ
jgi:prepilin-type N-terminal cleavage/methylation domain-containing protein